MKMNLIDNKTSNFLHTFSVNSGSDGNLRLLPSLYIDPEMEKLRELLTFREKMLYIKEREYNALKEQINTYETKALNELIDNYILLTELEIDYYSKRIENAIPQNDNIETIASTLIEKKELLELLLVKKEGKCSCHKKDLSIEDEKTLRTMYKWAMTKCHPDKNPFVQELSHQFSNEISKYYKEKDISRLNNLVARIKVGILNRQHFEYKNPGYYIQRMNSIKDLIENENEKIMELTEKPISLKIRSGVTIQQYIIDERELIQKRIENTKELIQLETLIIEK